MSNGHIPWALWKGHDTHMGSPWAASMAPGWTMTTDWVTYSFRVRLHSARVRLHSTMCASLAPERAFNGPRGSFLAPVEPHGTRERLCSSMMSFMLHGEPPWLQVELQSSRESPYCYKVSFNGSKSELPPGSRLSFAPTCSGLITPGRVSMAPGRAFVASGWAFVVPGWV